MYALTFLILSVACAGAAWSVGWAAAPPGYAAVSFAALGAAYAGSGPGLLLKRADGRRGVAAWLLFAPYFALNGLTFAAYRRRSREPAVTQVSADLSFGRRLTASECPAVGWAGVLDLAGEFAEVEPLRRSPGYLSLPVLDGTAPTPAQLRQALAWRADITGPVYVHCALGHGRSACVVVAFWLAAGEVATVVEGVSRLRAVRPGARLNRAQRRRLLGVWPGG